MNSAEEPRSLLIVLLGAIGDVARALCIPVLIKEKYPTCRITWLVEPRSADLVRANAAVDEVLIFERKKGLSALVACVRALRMRTFDVTLDMQRHAKSGFFSLCSAAPRRIGFAWRDSKECNWIFNNEYIEPFSEEKSKLEHYLLFLKPLAIAPPLDRVLDFGLAKAVSQADLSAFGLTSAPAFGLVLGSTWLSKDWPEDGYLGLLRWLRQRYPSFAVVLLGDAKNMARGERLSQALKDPAIYNLSGKTTILQLAKILQRLELCIGPDSGPAHIAGALGIPHVTLFGPTSPSRVAPYGSEELSLRSAIGCSPCYRRRCPGLGTLCMRLLSVQNVAAVIERTLGQV